VIGSSGSDLSKSIYIDKGSNDGIGPDMAVITAGGIVGKVLRVYASASLVLMINDQTSGVGVMLEKSRLQGVLKGTPEGEVVLERVMSDEQVTPGETVLSSGGEQIFPKGLPVGTVSKVSPGKEMFLNIRVKPAADLARLEEVLVITEKPERSVTADTGVRVRAADILAQRLPSVPDKPAADAAAVPGGTAATTTAQPKGAATPSRPQPPSAEDNPD
jgi:rod shape-determining protein MreC